MNVEFSRMNLRPFLIASLLGLLAACASNPQPRIEHADRLPGTQAGSNAGTDASGVTQIRSDVLEELGRDGPKPVTRRGNGPTITEGPASRRPPRLVRTGQASFTLAASRCTRWS